MRLGMADLIDDQRDCECGGGKWTVKSPTYGYCDPGPVTTGYYWDKPLQRCKSPFDKATKPFIGPDCPPQMLGACSPPGKFNAYTCECERPTQPVPGPVGPGSACQPGFHPVRDQRYAQGFRCEVDKQDLPSWAVPAAVAAGALILVLLVSR